MIVVAKKYICIVHYNECPITQKNILLMLSNLQYAQMKVALRNLNAARR